VCVFQWDNDYLFMLIAMEPFARSFYESLLVYRCVLFQGLERDWCNIQPSSVLVCVVLWTSRPPHDLSVVIVVVVVVVVG
jgi:hypothetical protein